mgnify:FL=1
MVDQTKEAMGYGQLIVDNVIGLDNDYDSVGEKLGRAFKEDKVGFLKTAASGVYEGAKEFVTSPIDSTKEILQEIKDSVSDLATKDLDTRLQEMYQVNSEKATANQINSAKETVLADAMVAAGLIPAAKGVTTALKVGTAAIPSGIKTDGVDQTKALLSENKDFASTTPKPVGFQPKPKNQVSPLVKVSANKPALDFYSSIPSALENLSVGKDGIAGSNVLAFLNKRAPNVNKTELYWSGLLETIDPNKKYNKAELISLSEKQTPKLEVQTLTGDDTVYFETQRVRLYYGDKLELPYRRSKYAEFLVKNNNPRKNNYDISKEEWNDRTVVAHARGSYNTDVDGDDFFLLEEIQSGPVQNNIIATPQEVKKNQVNDVNFNQYYTESLNSIIVEYSNDPNLELNFNPKFIKYAKDEYGVDGSEGAITNVDDLELFVEKSTIGLAEDFSTLKKDFLDGKQSYNDVSNFLQKKYKLKKSDLQEKDIDGIDPLDQMFANIITNFVYDKSEIKSKLKYVVEEDMMNIFNDPVSQENFNPLVPMKLSESIKVSLLSVIKDAKKRGVDKIYVPPNKDIEAAHSLGEEPTKNTYTDGLTKVLNTLKSETNGQITSKRKNPVGFNYKSKKTGLEIDITNFNIPENAQIRFNKGGSVANMARQTEMMFEEGGIADDGMTQDPVSGNEIPPGSLAEEVRDDIPAQLSEGEYVVPADVVRYYGVKFFENLRTKAKMGLQDMEEGGRIGGEPAPMPDDSGISDQELQQIIQEEMNAAAQQTPMMNMGGAVKKPTMYMAPGGLSTTTSGGLDTTSKLKSFTPPTISGPMQSVAYYNAATKETRYFMFINGVINPPGTVVPAGFTRQDGTGQEAPAPVTPEPVVEKTSDGGGNDDPPPTPPDYGDWAKDPDVFTTDPDKWAKSVLDAADATKRKGVIASLGVGALLNPVAGAMINLGARYSPQESIATVKARALVETAAGNVQAAATLNAAADAYAETQPGIANFFGGIFSSASAQAKAGVFEQLGFGDLTAEQISKDPTKSKAVQNFLNNIGKPKASPVTAPAGGGKPKTTPTTNNDGGGNDDPPFAPTTKSTAATAALDPTSAGQQQAADIVANSADPTGTQQNLDDVNNQLSQISQGANVGFNKGGLMTKKKKQR